MPLMVTGGFRTRAGIEEALDSGAVDVVGLGRPLCGEPDLPKPLHAREVSELPRYEQNKKPGPGVFGPTTKVLLVKQSKLLGQQGWFYRQTCRLSDGKQCVFKHTDVDACRLYIDGTQLVRRKR